jgi:methylated-DNA-protein-cysteine methyltransferase-like protein
MLLKKTNFNTNFFDQVYELVCKIPYGKVTTYGAIAKCLGSGKSARMVGWAINKSFAYSKYVPAHRVVNKKGLLTGKMHFGGPNVMQQLLENEGIKITNNQIVDFDKLFWDPVTELCFK